MCEHCNDVREAIYVDHDTTSPEHTREASEWAIPQHSLVAIEYLKRVRRSTYASAWDWSEDVKQSARITFSKLIASLELETECENCSESLADCSCTECYGCHKRFDSGDICSRCENCSDCCACPVCSNCSERVESVCEHCENCESCCECVTCNGCRRRGHPDDFYTCGDCGYCENCCECISCGYCGEHCESTCSDCDRCESCCNCDDGFNGCDGNHSPRLSFKEKFRKPTRKEFKRSPLKRFVGMELELVSVTDGEPLTEWAKTHNAGLVEDGSLTKEKQGVEIVTSPSMGDRFLDDCSTLGETLKDCGAAISDECGLHVHADARDYHTADLRRLIILYSAVERAMFELVSRTRMGNRYCQPCGFKYLKMLEGDGKGHKEFRKNLHVTLYDPDGDYQREPAKVFGEHIASEKKAKYHQSRYYALNLHTYFFRKTVEFRLHEAHLNPEVFTNWSLFCGWITEKAYGLSERQMLELFTRHANGNGESLLREILPADVSEWLLTRLETRRKAREDGQTLESTDDRLTAYTKPIDALSANIWHTASASAEIFSLRYRPSLTDGQKELF